MAARLPASRVRHRSGRDLRPAGRAPRRDGGPRPPARCDHGDARPPPVGIDTKVDRRFEHASETSRQIHEQLGRIGQTNEQMLERAKDLSRLQEALRPPKARGGFGEHLLANLLADTFPRDKYELQYGFKSGERVDAVSGSTARSSPSTRSSRSTTSSGWSRPRPTPTASCTRKQFARDVKNHVDAIAQKYIRPDEGTYEFALMYLPAEAVYYELVCGRLGAMPARSLRARAPGDPVSPSTSTRTCSCSYSASRACRSRSTRARSWPTSRSSGATSAASARTSSSSGKHLGNAQTRYADADRRLDKLEVRLERASESEPARADATSSRFRRALDAA